MRSVNRWQAFAAIAVALTANLAHAALFDDDEARRRIAETNVRLSQLQTQLETRLAQLEQQLRSGGLLDLSNQLELVRVDLAKLRGQIEVLTHELGEAQKRQRDLYVDLDSRMRKMETAQAAAAAAAVAPPPVAPGVDPGTAAVPPPQGTAPGASGTMSVPPVASGAPSTVPPLTQARPADAAAEQRAYDAALDLFKRGDFGGAIGAFTNYVRAYPRSPLSPSAQYWIGNAHFARRDFRAALTAQRTLIANYPDSAKVPDALLNIASAQGELGDSAGARRTLEEIVAKHPQSEAAPKARQRLAGR
jgi:tol-pal system protein YbgF